MTTVLVVLVVVLAAALAAVLGRSQLLHRARPAPTPVPGASRILFPFVATALSRRALNAALRIARAEEATLVPVFLARVPLRLPLDAPLPRQASVAIPLQEAIEQRAGAYGVPVDSRLERGRTIRHALRQTLANESYERLVVAAAVRGAHGFGPDDIAWLLAHAPGEILVLRPGAEDEQMAPDAARSRSGRSRARGPGAWEGVAGSARVAIGS